VRILRAEPLRRARVLSLPERAEADLAFIRETMARSATLTRLSGRATVAIGALALLGGEIARRSPDRAGWWVTWLAVGAIAFAGGLAALDRKGRAVGQGLRSGAGRRFAHGLLPPLLAGALLTAALARGGDTEWIPGVWLLLYGVALISGGATTVAVVRVLGAAFAAVGALALAAPSWGDALLSAGFGGLHIAFGAWIWRRYGG